MSKPAAPTLAEGARPRVSITSCPRCRWLLRDRVAPGRSPGHTDRHAAPQP